jgi:hypothetical protein
MHKTELTLEQAQAVSNDLQCLLGHFLDPVAIRSKYIQHVVPAPFDEQNKQFFMYVWRQVGCPERALQHYKAEAYDVILVAGEPSMEEHPAYRDAATFLQEHKIPFDIASYCSETLEAV